MTVPEDLDVSLRTLIRVLTHLGMEGISKLVFPPPDGYKFRVMLVPLMEPELEPELEPVDRAVVRLATLSELAHADLPCDAWAHGIGIWVTAGRFGDYVTEPAKCIGRAVQEASRQAREAAAGASDAPITNYWEGKSAFHRFERPIVAPYDPKLTYEFRGLLCDVHGQQPHRRERHAVGPWSCTVCAPAPEEGA
jgi:hypothetical protein